MSRKIEEFIKKMSIEEKVAQLQQIAGNEAKELVKPFVDMGTTGSFLSVFGAQVADFTREVANTPNEIPPIFAIDAIHGYSLLKEATIFPSQLSVACSFNDELVYQMGVVTGKEVAADGLDWVFSPVLCLGRDLRWGRVDETFGEDSYLASRLGAAVIKGYQKDDMVAACAKHYFGYGEATGGRDSYDTEITERKAREIFLKPFKAAIDADCMTIMTAYGSIDGTPLTASYRWMTEILRNELHFDGFVVTDWDNFNWLHKLHRVCEDMEEACITGLSAGNDMCMRSPEFYEICLRAVKEGKIDEKIIDEAVRRILRVKERLGLLDGTRKRPDKSVIGCEEHQAINYQLTVESMVLLKNNGVLPITDNAKIAVIGPNADDVRAHYGDWTYFSHPSHNPTATSKDCPNTLLKGIKEVYPNNYIGYAKGCSVDGEEDKKSSDEMMQEALDLAKKADVIVAVIGDNLRWNGEWKDVAHPILRGRQIELVQKLAALNKKIVTVLVNGKPLVLTEIVDCCDAIIETFNGGDLGGLAVAKLIKGEENFSAKLPISFPRAVGCDPNYYNQYDSWHGYKYADLPKGGSLFPFGFGLSYSKTVLNDLKLSAQKVNATDTVNLSVTVENQSDIDCKEVVQLYFRDKVCKVLTPIRQLIDYKKITLLAKQKEEIVFEIPVNTLGYYNQNNEYCVDAGEFDFFVSTDGVQFEKVTLTVV